MLNKKIRVVIIDDSLLFREFLSRSLNNDPQIEVIGVFSDPVDAMGRIGELSPDVIAVDMEMPKMRGNEFLRKVLPQHPNVKAIVISGISGNVFDAMHAGATDFVSKPNYRPGYDKEAFLKDVVSTIKIAAAASRPVQAAGVKPPKPTAPTPATSSARTINLAAVTPKSIIAIGASTGGTEATVDVVEDFPANTPGVVIVQHMPPVFTRMYAERLDRICKMTAREAVNGDRVERGLILVAPGDNQLRVRKDAAGYYVHISPGAKVSGHCPSVDVLFESAASAAGRDAVGVILTGMGADGAKGLLKMRQAGAYTIGQDQASSVVYGMPKVAFENGGVVKQLPLASIGDAVLRQFSK